MKTIKAYLERIRAVRKNQVWSWGATRPDGSIVFFGWEDEVIRTSDNKVESCLIWKDGLPVNKKHGGRERERHIEQIFERNSSGYLFIVTAKDIHASRRRILTFEESLYSVRLEQKGKDIYAVAIGQNSAPEGDFQSDNSPTIETSKHELYWARRGQGIFRSRLELIEPCCRLTGVTDRAHLRASHIKPWRASTNKERLDGNNGLLLAPHADHLFDRGFISFNDDGTLLRSPRLKGDLLKAWGLSAVKSRGKFSPEQSKYLAYHRKIHELIRT